MKVLIDEQYRKFLIGDNLDKDLQLDFGVLSKDQLNAAQNGDVLQSHLGKKVFVLDASFVDIFEKIKRGPQIITLKDAALIAAYTGISDKSIIVDAGAGSGALISYLGNVVKPSGKVYSYEVSDEFIKLASENIKDLNLQDTVIIKNKNIYDGIDEKNVDMLSLDLPEPWRVIEHANKSLKIGGYFVAYLPSMTQVQIFVSALTKNYRIEQIFEDLQRNWIVRGQIARPESMMLGHTGFITIARRLY